MLENVKHIIVNGEIVSSSVPSLFHNNLSFLNGDGLHERMHAYGTEIQFVDSHFQRLYKGMRVLKINIDDHISQQKVVREISRLLNRDKVFGGAEIRLNVFRVKDQDFGYVVDYEKLTVGNYQLQPKGLMIGVFKGIPKQFSVISAFPTNSSLLNSMADIYAKEENLDEVLLVNQKGNIIESSHSNVFIIKGNEVFTPSVSEGCVEGVMRQNLLNAAKNAGYEIYSNCIISEKNVSDADEVFLTNSIEGIKWVMAFGQRRYYNKTARILCDSINMLAFK